MIFGDFGLDWVGSIRTGLKIDLDWIEKNLLWFILWRLIVAETQNDTHFCGRTYFGTLFAYISYRSKCDLFIKIFDLKWPWNQVFRAAYLKSVIYQYNLPTFKAIRKLTFFWPLVTSVPKMTPNFKFDPIFINYRRY